MATVLHVDRAHFAFVTGAVQPRPAPNPSRAFHSFAKLRGAPSLFILAEGAIALSVTLSGGALFAS